MYGNETVILLEVTSKLFSKEKKKKLNGGGSNISSEYSILAVNNGKVKL